MLLFDDVQRPYLSVPAAAKEKGWLESVALSRLEHRWNHYLNQLTLAAVLPWLEQQGLEGRKPEVQQPEVQQPEDCTSPTRHAYAQLSPDPEAAAQRWQWVSGTALSLGDKRLIIVPTDRLDHQEFRVPQEWVDIPAWHGDYYLKVLINPEAGRLQLRGYLSHRQLKQGRYDEGDRHYCVDEIALIQDMDLLLVMALLESRRDLRAALAPMPRLPQDKVSALVQQLCHPLQQQDARGAASFPNGSTGGKSCIRETALSPAPLRLMLPSQQWCALLEEPGFAKSLRQALQSPPAETSTTPSSIGKESPAQLSQWLTGQFETAWQSLEQLSSSEFAWGVRNKLAQSVSRGKQITLQGGALKLTLWTTVTAEVDGRRKVLVQLRRSTTARASQTGHTRPGHAQTGHNTSTIPLPSGLQLALVTPAEESLQVVVAGSQDDCIQLKRFKVLPGQAFSVEVRLGQQALREQFRA